MRINNGKLAEQLGSQALKRAEARIRCGEKSDGIYEPSRRELKQLLTSRDLHYPSLVMFFLLVAFFGILYRLYAWVIVHKIYSFIVNLF